MIRLHSITGLTTCLLLLSASSSTAAESENKAIRVTTAAYKDVAVHITRSAGAVVPADQDSTISAHISAIIKHFHVDTGDEVNKGDLLVSLDCKENELKLQQANASLNAEMAMLEHATTQFRQAKQLNKQGSISRELYNQREAEEKRLQATVEANRTATALAQINVDRCRIMAPYDGYITQRHASVGELTTPGSALLQLVSRSNNIVETKINNRLLDSFSSGSNHRFVFNDRAYALAIEHILPVLDSATRNHIARLRFVDELATTGSVGKVEWQDAEASIPADYLVLRDNRYGVLIAVSDGGGNMRARFIAIEDAREGQPARLTLDENTQIISTGRFNVKNGDSLQISN